MRTFVSKLVLGLALLGCAPSEEEIKKEFTRYVAKANSCTVASDCALAFTGCPLGCFVAVRADRKKAVEKKAQDLIDEYERGGAVCEYDCAAPGPLACVESRCDATPQVR